MSDTTRPPNTAMIRTDMLSKQYGEVVAVENLTISVDAGEVFGLLGPNGAGKTTTIRMLSALIGPSKGTAHVAGHALGSNDIDIRRSVGILTESPGLYDQLSAERNLGFIAQLYEVEDVPGDKPQVSLCAERNLGFIAQLYEVEDVPGQVERYLRMLGLWDRRHEPVGTFSKGMRQKLAIARALLHEPQILFLDEPTSGLDPAVARLVREFIATLKEAGRTIVLSTHNLDEADRLCDRIAVLMTRLVALDTPTALRRQLFGQTVVFHLVEAKPNLAPLLETYPFVQEARLVDNKLVVTLDDPPQNNPVLIRTLVEADAQIQFVGELRRTLEDVYLHLVNDASNRE